MIARTLACCIALGLTAGMNTAFGAEPKTETKSEVKTAPKPEKVEKTGVLEVIKADPAKKEKYDTVLLKVGKETIKLIPAKDHKKEFKPLEVMGGKRVSVTGEFLPAKPPKYPLAAILVESFKELGTAK